MTTRKRTAAMARPRQTISHQDVAASDRKTARSNQNPPPAPALEQEHEDFRDMNEVYDEVDQGQMNMLRQQAEVQRRARGLFAPERDARFDGLHCVECGADMPRERLRLQRARCVACQTQVEYEARRAQETGAARRED